MTATAHAESPGRRTDAVGHDPAMFQSNAPCHDASDCLMDDRRYRAWRAAKLGSLEKQPDIPTISLQNPRRLTPSERHDVLRQIQARNFALYSVDSRCNDAIASDGEVLETLCAQFGLQVPVGNPAADAFGLSRIECVDSAGSGSVAFNRARYIPYTNRPLNWHTDGYYNDQAHTVRSFVLHCVRDAAEGGENAILDPEMLYILIRDEWPELLPALCRQDAFTIPGDTGADGSGRAAYTGAVFSTDPETGALYTRFTQRKRHIQWLESPDMEAALSRIDQILDSSHPALVRLTLKPGQGILCNNVLHSRSAFAANPDAAQGRLLFRLRFTQRIHPNPTTSV